MIIIPAIDIIDGKPVRLFQGDYAKKEEVGQSVVELAEDFGKRASYLHLVDLDGAKAGYPVNQELVGEAIKAAGIPVEIGGGIRTLEDIRSYLDLGAARVILGTSALEDPALLKEALAQHGSKIAVGLDCKDGKVCGSGWLTVSDNDYISFAKQMEDLGVQTIIFTDIATDGTLAGPNLEMLKKLKEAVAIDITASGGIKDMSHIRALNELGLYGAITGKAMYAGTLPLEEAVAYCEEKHAE